MLDLKVLVLVYNVIMELIQYSQLKLNLPMPMKLYVDKRANKFGMTIAAYIKHLIARDIEDKEYPVYQASEKVEKAYKKAMKNKKNSVLINGSLEDYFANAK